MKTAQYICINVGGTDWEGCRSFIKTALNPSYSFSCETSSKTGPINDGRRLNVIHEAIFVCTAFGDARGEIPAVGKGRNDSEGPIEDISSAWGDGGSGAFDANGEVAAMLTQHLIPG